jgi:predicted thioesterase
LRPDGDGSYTAWTGNYQQWDDVSSDGDSTYVYTTTDKAKETSSVENAPGYATGPISSVRVQFVARRTGGDDQKDQNDQIRAIMKVGANEVISGNLLPVSGATAYATYWYSRTTDPAGGAWDWADINALEAGVQGIAVESFAEVRVTQLFVLVTPGTGPDATLKIAYQVDPSPTDTTLRGPITEATGWYNLTWANQPEPNDGTWNWADINNVRFRFERNDPLFPDGSGSMSIYEVWIVIYFDVPDVHISPKQQTPVPTSIKINITNVEELYGFEFKLYYNTAVLTATSVSLGPFLNTTAGGTANTFGSIIEVDDTLGLVWATQTIIGDRSGGRLSGSWGVLATINFAAAPSGNSNFDLEMKLTGYNFAIKKTYPIDLTGAVVQPVHNVAITNVAASPTSVNQTQNVNVYVTVVNQGDYTETFPIKLLDYETGAQFGTATVSNLVPGTSQIASIAWDTTGFTGNYTLKAEIDTLGPPTETDTSDNTYTFEKVWIGPDVEILDVSPSPTKVYPGDPIAVNVTVKNKGPFSITFSVETYANRTATGTLTLLNTTTVSILTPAATRRYTFNWNTATYANGTYVLFANTSDIALEIKKEDNKFITPKEDEVYMGPDINVLSTATNTSSVYIGDKVRVNATIKNEGARPVTFDVKAFAQNSTHTIQVGSTQTVTNLASDTNQTVNFTWNTAGFANITYTIFANATKLPNETDTADNEKVGGTVYIGPDIGITSVTQNTTVAYAFPLPADKVGISVTVKNEGAKAVSSFDIKVFANRTSTGTVTQVNVTQTVPSLNPGASTTKTFTWNTAGYANDTYTIFANATILYGETDTADNRKVGGTVYIGPDVAVTSVSASPSIVAPGGSVTVSVTVKNEGARSISFTVETYANRTSTGTVALLNTTNISPPLGASSTKSFSFSWNTAGYANDTYTIFTNATIFTGETDTADNRRVDGTVYIGPDVAASGITFVSKTKAYQKETITVRVKAVNQGKTSISSFVIQLWANATWNGNMTWVMNKTVTNLAAGAGKSKTFTWNTQGFERGDYKLVAKINPLTGETDTADNTYTYGVTIRVKLLGDIDDNGIVNIYDTYLLGKAYGSQEAYRSTPRSPNWNADADLNGDNFITSTDLSALNEKYGKTS